MLLVIEQNALSPEQVTVVLNGKHIPKPPEDIVVVKKAYEIDEQADALNPYSIEEWLTAHSL